MQYKVIRIEEDMDFGCEERQPGERLMSVVILESEDGREISLKHDDERLYERDTTKEISLRWMKIVRSGKFRHENVCKKMLMDILDSSGRKK